MNKLTTVLVPVVASTALILAAAGTAAAVPTDVTFTITGGALSITAPVTSTLPTAASSPAAQDIAGPLGDVTVSDLRGTAVGWVASVISTAFTPVTVPAIPATAVDYTATTATVTGLATVVAASRTGIVGVGPVQTATATGSTRRPGTPP